MEILKLEAGKPATTLAPDAPMPAEGYVWLDLTYEEVDRLGPEVLRLTGVQLYEDHLEDARNLHHPSSFDSTAQYEVVIFRGLAPNHVASERILTRPMFLYNFDRLLATVRADDSRSVAQVRARFVTTAQRCPGDPDELAHRLLSAMVDHYLELRQSLTQRLDRWQRLLLDPRRPFRDWSKMLESRNDIRRLQNMCEEQRDAIQEWRDNRLADMSERLQVRIADLIEHIDRVLTHARAIERQAESTVELYFAATAYRTNEIMRLLTIITAIFMPLTLIAGIYGMNFEFIPGLHNPLGFWLSMGAMGLVVVGMLFWFRYRRWL